MFSLIDMSFSAINCLERFVSKITYDLSSETLNSTHDLSYKLLGYAANFSVNSTIIVKVFMKYKTLYRVAQKTHFHLLDVKLI